ncbi:MAG: DNA gyrase subunit A [Clostridia bacterium]|nr:DNA gyrase subunit A [Clostridia bacterium]
MADKEHNVLDYENIEQMIVNRNIESRVQEAFLEYSMSVIVSRALPDVRDGMKPGQRRVMYAMYEDHLTSDKPFRKSATTVGNVLGRYHPHGDQAVYGTMVRMAQPFSLRHPLIDGHGNFGNVDGDGAAAYRYTEARMSKLANELMADIEKDVVDFVPNFDNSRKEPTVLPSRFPNVLVNGSVGIAVGMATNIPPHNLGEVIDGTIHLIDNPEASVEEMMEYVKGPDFPTFATIYGRRGIIDAYTTGKGRVTVRSKAECEEDHHRIVVTEIPYMVNKSQLIEKMADLVKDKRIEGITGIRDESGRAGMRIVIECKRDANLQVILNQLYKNTQLQDTCAMNMLVLVNGEPKTLGLREILGEYIKFQEQVVERRTRFDLKKAQAEAHIYEGYKIAIDNIDEVISIIRSSESTQVAKERLKDRFLLSDEQSQAIVDMTLGRLSGMERQKVEDRLAKLHATVKELNEILADPARIREIIKSELEEIKRKYADERRTEIIDSEDEIDLEDLIERHECVITLTNSGYIKRIPADTYEAQHRGGKGLIAMGTKDEDFIENILVANSHAHLLMFTDNGKIFVRKVYRIPESSRTAKGSNLINLIEIEKGEKVTAMIPLMEFEENEYLVMLTRKGVIKRTRVKEYEYQRKGGKIAINLDEGDELIFVGHTKGNSDILIATKNGQGARFNENKVSVVGRTARGVRGIDLRDDDVVCGAVIVDETKQLLTVTENGFGKRSEFSDFEARNRGIFGVRAHNISDKTGKLATIGAVTEEDDIMAITDGGVVIRTHVSEVPVYNRSASGVRVMRIAEGSKVAKMTFTAREDDEAEGGATDVNGENATEGAVNAEAVADVSAEAQAPDTAEGAQVSEKPDGENE